MSAARLAFVVVPAVHAEYVLELAPANDENTIEGVGADRANPTFHLGVRVRSRNWRSDDLDALGPEELVGPNEPADDARKSHPNGRMMLARAGSSVLANERVPEMPARREMRGMDSCRM